MSVPRLEMRLYGDVAARLLGGREQVAAHTVETGPAFPRVSAAWGATLVPERLLLWLDACLPENGLRLVYESSASRALVRAGLGELPMGPVDITWGNAYREYPGAVSFRCLEDTIARPHSGYQRLSDDELGRHLAAMDWISQRGEAPRPDDLPTARPSLAGMRGKTSLAGPPGGGWSVPYGGALGTWIVKIEDRSELPGEAGVESVCQRAFSLIDIPAARTQARMLAGIQCILSERSDRNTDPATGVITARHQEELIQATARSRFDKYDPDKPPKPPKPFWPEAYRLLDGASAPAEERRLLTRIVVASWAIGHVDLHRRNLGIQHSLPGEPEALRLAPVYDVATGIGVDERIVPNLAIAVGGEREFHRIGPEQWIRHAGECGLVPGDTLDVVTEILRVLPEAVSEARRQAAVEDECRDQPRVDRRIEGVLRWLNRRAEAWDRGRGPPSRSAGVGPSTAETAPVPSTPPSRLPGVRPKAPSRAPSARLARSKGPDGGPEL